MTSKLWKALRGLTLAALMVAGCRPAPVRAQQHPITWTLTTTTRAPQQGQQFTVTLVAQIPFGWHLYSTTQPPGGPVRTVIRIVGDNNFVMTGTERVRDPDMAPDPNFDIPGSGPLITETYLDSVTFVLPIVAKVSGKRTLRIGVHYQTCTNRMCLPAADDTLELRLDLASGAVPAAIANAPPPPPPEETATPSPGGTAVAPTATSLPGGTTQSLPLFLWFAAVMGALSLLTPCVFPMIPITVSYFTRTNETARGSPARNALVYAAGIIATFTVLGMAIAVLVGAGGINRFAANPWINLLITGVFVAFALNLFGVYEISLPASLLTRLDGATRRGGGSETLGIVLMGLTFTLTSFTCTTPFVGTLLVMAARGSWVWPLAGLLVFSGVFALPFFLLALMPSAVAKLPRSGSWLQSVKVVMGFVELATAMKFLSNADLVLQWGVITRTVVLAAWIAIALLTVMYLLGIVGRPAGAPRAQPGPIRIGVILATLAITVYLGLGLTGRRVGELESFLPPPEGGIATGETSVPGELSWMVNDYEGGLKRAAAEHKQVLVDFTGYTCTNCRWMEANMFPRPAVVQELDGFVRVRLYTDGQGEVYRRQQKLEQDKLGTVALPYYAIIDSLGVIQGQFLGMTRDSEQFVEFLRGRLSLSTP